MRPKSWRTRLRAPGTKTTKTPAEVSRSETIRLLQRLSAAAWNRQGCEPAPPLTALLIQQPCRSVTQHPGVLPVRNPLPGSASTAARQKPSDPLDLWENYKPHVLPRLQWEELRSKGLFLFSSAGRRKPPLASPRGIPRCHGSVFTI